MLRVSDPTTIKCEHGVEYQSYPHGKRDLVSDFHFRGMIEYGFLPDSLGRGPFGCPIDCVLLENGWVWDECVFWDPKVWSEKEIQDMYTWGRQYQDMKGRFESSDSVKERGVLKEEMKKLRNTVKRFIKKHHSVLETEDYEKYY